MTDEFTVDITAKARWARETNDDYPKPAWSTGEKVAVALVLGNQNYLDLLDCTREAAVSRISGDLLGVDVEAWIRDVRRAIGITEVTVTFDPHDPASIIRELRAAVDPKTLNIVAREELAR